MLYEITGFSCFRDETAIRTLKAHNYTTLIVFCDKTSGDGHEVGHQHINSLTRVIEHESLSSAEFD